MPFCCYLGCNSSSSHKGISFFGFPTEKHRRQRWCNLIKRQHGRDDFNADKARICHKHFADSHIIRGWGSCRKARLCNNAEPHPYYASHERKRKEPTPRPSQERKREEPTPRHSQERKRKEPTPSPDKSNQKKKKTGNKPTSHSTATSQVLETIVPRTCDVAASQVPETIVSGTCDVAVQCDIGLFPGNSTSCDVSVQCDMTDIEVMQAEINRLERQLEDISSHNEELQEQYFKLLGENNEWSRRLFSYENLTEKEIPFYTGFPDLDSLEAMYKFLDPGENLENIALSDTNEQATDNWKRGPAPKLCGRDLYLMTLCRLRQGFMEFHLSKLFNISLSRVSVYLNAMINFMYLKLGSLPIWPEKGEVLQCMPAEFKKKYPSVRCIIDCTEIYSQCPSSLRNQSMMYSHYKGRMTYKALVGITPGGGASFISALYPGSLSDRAIVERCGLLQRELWNVGDSIMADRGFTIEDLLEPMGVELNIPAFLGGRAQFSKEEVIETQQIASWRIHVERYIRKIKSFHIFDRPIPLAMHGSINQIWTVCAMLANANSALISTSLESDVDCDM